MDKFTKNLSKWAVIKKSDKTNMADLEVIKLDNYIKYLRQEGYTIIDQR